jgi:hypothetical protein
MVERVARAMWRKQSAAAWEAGIYERDQFRAFAQAALEASHHAELVEALDPFARVARLNDAAGLDASDERPCRDFFPGMWPTLGDCRRAAAIIAKIGGEA